MKFASLARNGCAIFALIMSCGIGLSTSARAQDTTVVTPSETPAPGSAPAQAATPSAPSSSSSSPAPTDNSAHSSRIQVGPDIGFYLPTSSKTRDRFGSSWFSVGIGIGSLQTARESGGFGFDASLISHTGSGSHAYIAPIGVQYRKALSAGVDSVPYVGIGADLVLADLRSPVQSDDVHSGLRTAGGVGAILGTTINRNGYIEARYEFISKIKSFDLSGVNLTAGLRF